MAEIAPPAAALRCGICQSALSAGEARLRCPDCDMEYHADCWQENGGCAVYGCPRVPATERRTSLEIPAAHWGQEHKPCPACGAQILAAALRCRSCGATFLSERLENADQYQSRKRQELSTPALRHRIAVLFLLSLIPITALPAAGYGYYWYSRCRTEIHAQPALYPALCKIGIAVGAAQTVLLALAALLTVLRA